MKLLNVVGCCVTLAGIACAPDPPPRWASGGAPLVLGEARWQRGDEPIVHVNAEGEVREGDDLVFVIDRVGRVTDGDYEPYAILTTDGRVVGTGRQGLGRIGLTNASPPGASNAWLQVDGMGQVTFFDPDGDRHPGGQWLGCGGYVARTCTLVTHLAMLRTISTRRDDPLFRPSFGVLFSL